MVLEEAEWKKKKTNINSPVSLDKTESPAF